MASNLLNTRKRARSQTNSVSDDDEASGQGQRIPQSFERLVKRPKSEAKPDPNRTDGLDSNSGSPNPDPTGQTGSEESTTPPAMSQTRRRSHSAQAVAEQVDDNALTTGQTSAISALQTKVEQMDRNVQHKFDTIMEAFVGDGGKRQLQRIVYSTHKDKEALQEDIIRLATERDYWMLCTNHEQQRVGRLNRKNQRLQDQIEALKDELELAEELSPTEQADLDAEVDYWQAQAMDAELYADRRQAEEDLEDRLSDVFGYEDEQASDGEVDYNYRMDVQANHRESSNDSW